MVRKMQSNSGFFISRGRRSKPIRMKFIVLASNYRLRSYCRMSDLVLIDKDGWAQEPSENSKIAKICCVPILTLIADGVGRGAPRVDNL